MTELNEEKITYVDKPAEYTLSMKVNIKSGYTKPNQLVQINNKAIKEEILKKKENLVITEEYYMKPEKCKV